MIRPRLTLALCTLALAVASTASLAQNTAGPVTAPAPPPGVPHFDHPGFRPPGFERQGFGPEWGVLQTLNELQRLYVESGRAGELPALYNEVLGKTRNPRLRQALYQRLAQAQLRPTHVDAAIATLRKSLNESLADEARMAAEHPHPGPQGPALQAPPPPHP